MCRLILLVSCMVPCLAEAKPVKVVLMSGQSNMLGCGRNRELPMALKSPQTEVLIWSGNKWAPVEPGLGANRGVQFGPEISLGPALRKAWPEAEIRLIKLAYNGQELGGSLLPGKGQNYLAFLQGTRAALANLKASGKEYEIAGMLWMQGESDGMKMGYAKAYEKNLTDLIRMVRMEFKSPEMPFILGRVGTHYDSKPKGGTAIVRAAQVAVAKADRRVICFDTDDLPFASYNPGHYNTEGQLKMGQRFAERLLDLTSPPTHDH